MKITEVTYGETVPHPIVSYSSLRPEFKCQLEEGETVQQAIEFLKEQCKEAVSLVLEIEENQQRQERQEKRLEYRAEKIKAQFAKAEEVWDTAIGNYEKLLKILENAGINVGNYPSFNHVQWPQFSDIPGSLELIESEDSASSNNEGDSFNDGVF